MKYNQFIDALEPLIEEAKNLFDREELDEGQDFRRWRHQVTDLIHRIKDEGYSVDSSMAGRYFDNTYYMATKQERLDAYNRDLQDTVDELKTIAARYRQFGEPRKSARSGNISNLSASLSKIIKHPIWWVIGGAVSIVIITWILVHITGQSSHP